MAKVVYIIPGFTESTNLKRYHKITKFFKNNGFKTVLANITWKHRTMSDYVKEFENQFNQHNKNDDVYLFGFSFGAMISFIFSSQVKPKAQFLCSLSPYFSEDIPLIKEWWKKSIGLKRVKDFKLLSFNKISKQILCKTFIFAGTKEGPKIKRRAKIAHKQIKNSELFMINGAKHDISQNAYINRLKKVILKI